MAGAPSARKEEAQEVIEEWETSDPDSPSCYFGAEERVHEVLGHAQGFATVILGAQPVWSRKVGPVILTPTNPSATNSTGRRTRKSL